MKSEHITAAIEKATTDVFSTMLGLEAVLQTPTMDHSCPSINEGVMAFVGIAGTWVGNGVISCDAAFACKLSDAFMMTEASTMNEEVLDSIGELANMVIGNFKTEAESEVGPLALGVPTVVYGRNFRSRSLGTNDWLVLPFMCGENAFEVRIWFSKAPEPSAAKQPHHAALQVI